MSAYRITEVGFDKADAIFLRTTIEIASGFDIATWICVSDLDADVILVNSDKDMYTSELNLEKLANAKNNPILIGFSSRGKKSDSFSYTLEKPITYSMITNLLLKLEQELTVGKQTKFPLPDQHDELNNEQNSNTSLHKEISSETGLQPGTHAFSTPQLTGDSQDQNNQLIDIEDSEYDKFAMDSEFGSIQPDVTPSSDNNPQQTPTNRSKSTRKFHRIKTHKQMLRPTRWFLEETRFLGLIREPAFLTHPTEITHYIFPPVRIYPEQQVFSSSSYLGLPHDFFRSRVSGFSIHELIKSDQQVPPENWNSWPLWLLFYLATLYGSEGRLKENYNPDDRLRLTSIPDFDIVPNHTDYKVIADYMISNEPQDLNTIADGSGVNIATVIDFCNACEEIDIIDRTPSTHTEIRLSTDISHNSEPERSISEKYAAANKRLIKRFKSIFNNTG